jgi:hypothetical protein
MAFVKGDRVHAEAGFALVKFVSLEAGFTGPDKLGIKVRIKGIGLLFPGGPLKARREASGRIVLPGGLLVPVILNLAALSPGHGQRIKAGPKAFQPDKPSPGRRLRGQVLGRGWDTVRGGTKIRIRAEQKLLEYLGTDPRLTKPFS